MFYNSKEKRKKLKKIVRNNLYILAHNGSGFDRYVVLNNLPQRKTVVNLIKSGAGIVSLKYSMVM